MSSKPRTEYKLRSAHRIGLTSLAALLAVASAGCSADVARFDFPAFGLTETPSSPRPPSSPTGALADEGRRDGPGDESFRPPMRSGASPREGVRVSNLPEVPQAPAARPEPPRERVREAAVRPSPATDTPPPPGPGTTIEVKQGDTIYGLSRRHGVSIQVILEANNLKTPTIKPGQKLVIPSPDAAPAPRPRVVAEAPRPAPATTPPAPADGPGTYTVKPGDSPFLIARRHGLKVGELLALNDIKDPTKVRPGTVLKVARTGTPPQTPTAEPPAPPLSTATPRATPPAPVAKPKVEPIAKAEPPPPSTGTRPRMIGHADPAPTKPEAPTRIASADPQAPIPGTPQEKPKAEDEKAEAPPQKEAPVKEAKVATPEKAAGTPKLSSAAKFRWPVKGKVIAKFGPRSDGGHNDGINIAVPQGTDVMAAENGMVVYAGSELKGYGNLVLVRHDNNYVTAYAHNDQILVRRNDKVRRGQILAKAGKSGAVDQPQVHFEIRQGSKPVDPLPYLDPAQ